MRSKYVEYVAEPGQEYIVRGKIVASALAAVNTHALVDQLQPWLVELLKLCTSELLAVNNTRPYRHGSISRILPYPRSLVM